MAITVFVCTIIIIMSIISFQVVIQAYKFKHTIDPINHKLEVEKVQEQKKEQR